jgi:predicted nucleic acid-binding protein
MVIADTGFSIALADRRDAFHEAATAAYDAIREPLITTWPIVTEACYLFLSRFGSKAQLSFLHAYAEGAFEIFEIEPGHVRRLEALLERYADLPMDLAGASLVLLAENLGHGRILSTDQRDFRTYRWKDRQPFQNLLAVP